MKIEIVLKKLLFQYKKTGGKKILLKKWCFVNLKFI